MSTTLTLATGLALLTTTLFFHSSEAPGFQYDEAWWALFTHRISTEPDFRPLTGMSPYTSALPAYVTAAAFKVLGPKISVFRGVAKIYVLIGTALLSGSLITAGQALTGALLPLVIAFFPALVMNQRWAVELNTLSVLCVGLIALGLAKRWKRGPSIQNYALILAGVALSITTHIFLFAPLLALWGCLMAGQALKALSDRFAATIAALIVAAFATNVYIQDPTRKEVILVIVAALAVAIKTWSDRVQSIAPKVLKVLAILATPLLVPLLVHLDGNWQARQYVGFLDQPLWQGTVLIPLSLMGYFLAKRTPPPRPLSWVALAFLPLTLIFTYSMVGRVGARFLEIPFLLVASAIAFGVSCLSVKERWITLALWCALGGGELWQNYLKPSIEHRQIAHVTRLWKIMKDSSEDFVSKQPVINTLTRAHCGLNDLHPDTRTLELSFLALADWPQPQGQRCLLGESIRVVPTASDAPDYTKSQ